MSNLELKKRELRDHLDRLYKKFVFLNSNAFDLVRVTCSQAGTFDAPPGRRAMPEELAACYRFMQQASPNSSYYADAVAKAVQGLDPLWCQNWANYAVVLAQNPGAYVMPPNLSVSQRENPPSNMIKCARR